MTGSDPTEEQDGHAEEPVFVPFESVEMPDLHRRLGELCEELGVAPESVEGQVLRQRLRNGADIRVLRRERGGE